MNADLIDGEENAWSYTFGNLPVYENGSAIEYTLTEDEVDGYETKIETTVDSQESEDGEDSEAQEDRVTGFTVTIMFTSLRSRSSPFSLSHWSIPVI